MQEHEAYIHSRISPWYSDTLDFGVNNLTQLPIQHFLGNLICGFFFPFPVLLFMCVLWGLLFGRPCFMYY